MVVVSRSSLTASCGMLGKLAGATLKQEAGWFKLRPVWPCTKLESGTGTIPQAVGVAKATTREGVDVFVFNLTSGWFTAITPCVFNRPGAGDNAALDKDGNSAATAKTIKLLLKILIFNFGAYLF